MVYKTTFMRKILFYIIPFIVINSIYAENKNNSLNVLAQAKVQQVAIERSIGNQQTNSVNSLPEQDLSGAITVCQNSYSVSNSYTGAGLISEINNVNTCLGTGEQKLIWYLKIVLRVR